MGAGGSLDVWGTSFEVDEGSCLDDELLGAGVSELDVTTGGFVEDEELLELVLDSEVGSAGVEVDDGWGVEPVEAASVFFASALSSCLC